MCTLPLGENGLEKYRLSKKWEQFKIVLLFMDHPVCISHLVSHVGVGEVEAGEHDGLQLVLAGHLGRHHLPQQQVDEHHVGRVDEGDVLREEQQQNNVSDRFPFPFYYIL